MEAMAIPLLESKVQAWKDWVQECQGPRREEFEDFNIRMGLTTHRAWLTESRQGPLAIVVVDGPGAGTFMQKMATSNEPFDKWFRERVSEFHGIDFSNPSAVPPSELFMDWYVPGYAEISA
jgi:hypothetical protein